MAHTAADLNVSVGEPSVVAVQAKGGTTDQVSGRTRPPTSQVGDASQDIATGKHATSTRRSASADETRCAEAVHRLAQIAGRPGKAQPHHPVTVHRVEVDAWGERNPGRG